MKCINCGAEIADSSKFCNNCGSMQPTPEQFPITSNETNAAPKTENRQIPVSEKEVTPPAGNVNTTASQKPMGCFGVIISIILCIVIFSSALFGMLHLTLRSLLSPNNVTSILESVDASLVVELLESNDVYIEGIDTDDLEDILEESNILSFFKERIGKYCGYILGGIKPAELDSDEFVSVVMSDKKLIVKELGSEFTFTEADAYDAYDEIEPILEEYIYDNEAFDEALDTLRIVMSIWISGVCFMVALIFGALLFVVNRKKANALSCFGITLIVTGIAYFITCLLTYMSLTLLPSLDYIATELINIVLNSITEDVIIVGALAIVLGIVMTVARKFASKIFG